jgi:ribosomal protein S18 acetylase RimI-like enzyme
MKITIRNSQPGDIGWIISMHGEIYAKEFNFDPYFEFHIASKMLDFLEAIERSFGEIWICEADGERAGSIAVSKDLENRAFINFLLVPEKYRGHGIGRILLDAVIERIRKEGLKTVRLETYSCLKSARELYQKAGFHIAEIEKDVHLFGQLFDQEFWEMRF